MRTAQAKTFGKPERKRRRERHKRNPDDNIKVCLKETRCWDWSVSGHGSTVSSCEHSYQLSCLYFMGIAIAQSVLRLATGWPVRGSNPGGDKIFRTRTYRPWGRPSLLYNGYRVFPRGKAAGAWC